MDVAEKAGVLDVVEVGVEVKVETGVLVEVNVDVKAEVGVNELVGFCPPPLLLEGEVGLFLPGHPSIKKVIPIKSEKIQILRFEIITTPPKKCFEKSDMENELSVHMVF